MKQTEIGLIPEGWGVVKIGEVANKVTDGTHDTPKPTEKGIPFLTAIHVKSNVIDYNNCYYLPIDIHKTIYNRCNPELGDVLMVNIGAGVGNSALNIVDYEFSLKNVALIKPNKEVLSGGFLNQFQNFNRDWILTNLITGGAQPFLSLNQISNLQIPLPPLTEQEAIANALSDADAWIEKLEQLIAKKRLIKQGAMQTLLTPPSRTSGIGGIGTSDAEALEAWEVKKLGEIGDIITGNTPSTRDESNYGDEFLFISPADLGERKYIKHSEKKLSKKGFALTRKLKTKSVLVTCIGSTIGKIGMASFECCTNQQINSIICFDNFNNEFVYYLLLLNAEAIKQSASQQAVPLINKSDFSELEFSFPTLSEQERIATVLSDMDAEIDALEQQLGKARHIKQGMMQELLTGRTRLV